MKLVFLALTIVIAIAIVAFIASTCGNSGWRVAVPQPARVVTAIKI
jgi:hypothetical protein